VHRDHIGFCKEELDGGIKLSNSGLPLCDWNHEQAQG
jgi:hypothetical protein